MTWLVSTSLRFRVVVLALSVLLIVFGIRTLRTTPLDVFPEFAPPLVEIQTEAPGLSTEEVESMITMPLENALNGTPWKKIIRSKSVLGLSSVVLIFEEGTDLIRARQLVQERLATEASRLPAVAHPPVILSPLSSTSRALKIGITSAEAFADGDDRTGPLDDPPAADGRCRRGQRRHLGPARPSVSGARRSGQRCKRIEVSLGADRTGRGRRRHARRGRLCRYAQPATGGAASQVGVSSMPKTWATCKSISATARRCGCGTWPR